MAGLTLSGEAAGVLEPRQVWFTNLLLLGFDPVAQEEKTKVHFCKEMFVHINKKGMEVILHYLFNRLDSHTAYEEFRDCWPVYDKKQEAQFRKVCSNWLTKISKESAESKIPRLSASLLMSPGGERFEQLMLRFTSYVVRIVCLREAKGEEKQVFLSSFVTAPSTLSLSSCPSRHLLCRALQCHTVRHTQRVVRRLELTSNLHNQWRQFVTEQVSEYRSLGKEKRELEAQLKEASASISNVRSTPSADKARKKKMKMVRGYWKSLEEFLSKSAHEREVVGSVAKGNANKYTVDAKDLQFQIPDVILPMYEAQLREGTAGNTYEGGKLNLLSLVQLWNCALQLTRDKFKECEVPSFQGELEEMKELLQAHRVNLATSQNLRASLVEYQQSLQESIESLEKELQTLRERTSRGVGGGGEGELQTPHQLNIPPITLPSLSLELLPPSPQKALSSPDMRPLHNRLAHLSLPNDHVSTPEAVHNISVSIQRQSRSQVSVPPRSHSIPTPKSPLHHHHPSHPLPSPPHNHRGISEGSGQRTVVSIKSKKKRENKLRSRPHPPMMERSGRHVGGVTEKATPTKARTGVSGLDSPQIKPTNPPLMDSMPAAHDILASQIAAAVADDFPLSSASPEHQIHAITDPLSALGQEAFVSHDKIPRTPPTSNSSLLHSSTPPLSPQVTQIPMSPLHTLSLTPSLSVKGTSTLPHNLSGTRSPLTTSHLTPAPSHTLTTSNTLRGTTSPSSHLTLTPGTASPLTTSHLTPTLPHTLTNTRSPLTSPHFTPTCTLPHTLTNTRSPSASSHFTPTCTLPHALTNTRSPSASSHLTPTLPHTLTNTNSPFTSSHLTPTLPHTLTSTNSPSYLTPTLPHTLTNTTSPLKTGPLHLGNSPLSTQSLRSPLPVSSTTGQYLSSSLIPDTPLTTRPVEKTPTQAPGNSGGIGTPVHPTGGPLCTTQDQLEKTSTYTPAAPTRENRRTETNPRIIGSAMKSQSQKSVSLTPLAFSLTPKDSSFLLSSQPPTPGFLHDVSSSSEEGEGEMEGQVEGEREGEMEREMEGDIEGERKTKVEGEMEGEIKREVEGERETEVEGDMEGKGEEESEGKMEGMREGEGEYGISDRANYHHLLSSPATGGSLSSNGAMAADKVQLGTDFQTKLETNGIPLGFPILTQSLGTPSPSTSHLLTFSPSTSHLLTSSPSTSHLLTFSPSTSHCLTSSPLLTSSPSTSHCLTTVPASSPAAGEPPLLIDLSPNPVAVVAGEEGEWRPLDVSTDHSNCSGVSSTTPLNLSMKLVQKHQPGSNGGTGLFDEEDSFLVPLSPHSDFSSDQDSIY